VKRVYLTARRSVECTDLADASRKVQAYRDATGLGSSRYSGGSVVESNVGAIAYVSYNGRVWASEYKPGKPVPALLMEASV
jgi:hypothetical protein